MPWDVHPTFSVNGAPPLLYILIFAEQEQNGILKSIIRHRGNNYSQTFMIIIHALVAAPKITVYAPLAQGIIPVGKT